MQDNYYPVSRLEDAKEILVLTAVFSLTGLCMRCPQSL